MGWLTESRRAVLSAGVLGGLAMVPVGVVLRLLGQDVNEYGEATLATLTGTTSPPAEPLLMLVLHLLIACAAVVPLAAAVLLFAHRVRPLVIGAAYGVVWWAAVNALALPIAYERPTAYENGWGDVWPSLAVHVVFGVVAAVALARAPGMAATITVE